MKRTAGEVCGTTAEEHEPPAFKDAEHGFGGEKIGHGGNAPLTQARTRAILAVLNLRRFPGPVLMVNHGAGFGFIPHAGGC
jgi:hypothetical protein